MIRYANGLRDAIDRLVVAALQGVVPSDDDIETLRNDWDDIFGRTDYVTNGVPFGAIQSRLNDHDLADYQGIDIHELTDELRVEYARERLASEASDLDADYCPAIRAGTISSAAGLDAWDSFSVTGCVDLRAQSDNFCRPCSCQPNFPIAHLSILANNSPPIRGV